ncbi:MAG TPA: isochorismatase family protein [Methylophilaceae bacterium]|nr:isochorismatase family protein [Methylophilaceae bacterium]
MNADLSRRDLSCLVVVDMQEKLAAAMAVDDMQAVTRNCSLLIQAAKLLEIPVIYTEQYPKGLGPTLPELAELLSGKPRIEKTAFSCSNVPAFCRHLTKDKPHLILTGMEAHICILQTALGLKQQDRNRVIFIAEDAVISRNSSARINAMERLRHAGVTVSNSDSIVFEWLGKAEGDIFKQISRLLR